MRTVLGDRQACLARELTKLHEETLRGTLSQLQDKIAQKSILGECVLVLAGAEEFTYADSEEDINKRVSVAIGAYLEEGLGVKEISTKCAKEFGLQSSIVYKLALGLINKDKIGTDLSESSTD
jgi:16S rRNA (cytidine1402-2'-O)-methyltransferase